MNATHPAPAALPDDVRNLIVCDTQFNERGETTLNWSQLQRLIDLGWIGEGHENGEFDITDAGRAVIDRALALNGTPGSVADRSGESTGPVVGGAALVQQPSVSAVTRELIERDQKGLAKYGVSLDRTDLSLADWLQHLAEELLDGAGYALAAKRTALAPPQPQPSVDLQRFRNFVTMCQDLRGPEPDHWTTAELMLAELMDILDSQREGA